MVADSLTAPAPHGLGGQDRHGPGWPEQARSAVFWGVAHGLPMLAVRSAARRGDLAGRLTLAPTGRPRGGEGGPVQPGLPIRRAGAR
jgi:hypothetical protein